MVHRMFYILILVVHCFGSDQFLRFVNFLDLNTHLTFYNYPQSRSPIHVDAAFSRHVRIRIVDLINQNPELRFHCKVSGLDVNHEIHQAFLCRREKLVVTHEDCLPVESGKRVRFKHIDFTVIGNNTHGYTFISRLPVRKSGLDGFYSCKLSNKNSHLESNFVELQNQYYYIQELTRQYEPIEKFLPDLTADSLPLHLNCGNQKGIVHTPPSWADDNLPGPFKWNFCDFPHNDQSKEYACIRSIRLHHIDVKEYFKNFVFTNGTLVLLGYESAFWRDMGLSCWSFLNSSMVYATYFGGDRKHPKPISYNPDAPYSHTGIQVLSSMEQTVELQTGPNENARLLAQYRADPSKTQYEWTKGGENLPLGFPPPTPFMLTLPKIIHRNHSGTYQLTLRGDNNRMVRFRFNVIVGGPPEVRQLPPRVLHVMQGGNATFQFEMEGFDTKFLEINGRRILPGSTSSQRRQLVDDYPHLRDVNFQLLHSSGSVLNYFASNLFFQPGSYIGPSHMVTIVGQNRYGVARLYTLVNVLPLPTVNVSPKNCTGNSCLNSRSHSFECAFDLTPYENTLQTWDLNKVDVSKMHELGNERAKYLEFDSQNILNLKPVDDAEDVKLFQNTLITCRLRIFDKVFRSTLSMDSMEPIYDSRNDPDIQSSLTAFLNLEVDPNVDPSSAGFSWMAAVIIAIVIVLAIGTLTACIVMRTRGETYLLDKEERALGNDPEKELREKEVFRTYERAEEPPLRGSRYSLNDESAEICSDADGELDDYNLDPGKFNEEGSFIDQYATETPYGGGGAQRLPTLSRPYDSLIRT